MSDPGSPLPSLLKKESAPSRSSIFFKSFLFMLCVIALAVGMNRFFGWMAVETPDTAALFTQITDGRVEMRRMAAVEWVRQLQMSDDRKDEVSLGQLRPSDDHLRILGPDFVRSADCSGRDPVLMTSQATWLGYSRTPERGQELLRNFLQGLPGDSCIEARIMALASLIRLGVTDVDFSLIEAASESQDPSVRKIGTFGLGQLDRWSPELQKNAEARLKVLISDSVDDVRWNAAIALASRAPTEATPVLKQLLLRAKGQVTLTSSEFDLYREVFRAALRARDTELRSELMALSREHPHLKLRQAAKEILQKS